MSDDTAIQPSIKKAIKITSAGTLAVGAILLQVMVFRAVGDVVTSVILFGIGYAYGKFTK